MSSHPVVFLGPSGAGKSTLAQLLTDLMPELTLHETHTTRPPRSDNDKSHVFVDSKRFEEMRKNNDFIGTLDIFGYSYGLTPLPKNKRCLLLLRVSALPKLRQAYPESLVIQIDAPIPILRQRLKARSSLDRINDDILRQEINEGRALADLHIDSSASVQKCVDRIYAHLNK